MNFLNLENLKRGAKPFEPQCAKFALQMTSHLNFFWGEAVTTEFELFEAVRLRLVVAVSKQIVSEADGVSLPSRSKMISVKKGTKLASWPCCCLYSFNCSMIFSSLDMLDSMKRRF